jgi:Ca-activated chloride channel family protein
LAAGITGAWLGTGLIPAALLAQTPQRPTFRSTVDVVALTAVVHDRKGRPVVNLVKEDFAVLEQGVSRPIVEFRTEPDGPLSLAIVVDTSGSMRISRKWEMAHEVIRQLLVQLDPERDEAALYAFDSRLREVRRFANEIDSIPSVLAELHPFGETSLYDAMAATASKFTGEGPARRAMIVITDGVDTSSRLTPEQAWTVASAVDAPAYIILVRSPIDEGEMETARLQDLVRWTGGYTFSVSAPAHASVTTRRMTQELRQRYVIAFEAASQPGWHPLEVRTRDKDHVVRTRSGYHRTG